MHTRNNRFLAIKTQHAGSPTPELTRREELREASDFADDIQADSAPVE